MLKLRESFNNLNQSGDWDDPTGVLIFADEVSTNEDLLYYFKNGTMSVLRRLKAAWSLAAAMHIDADEDDPLDNYDNATASGKLERDFHFLGNASSDLALAFQAAGDQILNWKPRTQGKKIQIYLEILQKIATTARRVRPLLQGQTDPKAAKVGEAYFELAFYVEQFLRGFNNARQMVGAQRKPPKRPRQL